MSTPERLVSLFFAIGLAAASCVGCTRQDPATEVDRQVAELPDAATAAQSHTQVRGSGVVTRLLPDDDDGSSHQRFIIRLASGQTLLVAHNTDLAPAVADLRVGDTIEYNGEYEWNPKGGVVHWTHHDPAHQHVDGWLKHDGHVFQ